MKKNMLETSLINRTTLKTDERIAFFSLADELSSYIMELSHFINEPFIKEKLLTIVKNLSLIMGIVAGSKDVFRNELLDQLNTQIKIYQNNSMQPKGFILPGQTLLSSKIHVVRSISRKTEIAYAHVYEKYGGDDIIFEYLNKLSTYFFELANRFEKITN